MDMNDIVNVAFLIIMSAAQIAAIVAAVMFCRTGLVFRTRNDILRRSGWDNEACTFIGYEALPSYHAMAWDWSKWRQQDWEKNLPENWDKDVL